MPSQIFFHRVTVESHVIIGCEEWGMVGGVLDGRSLDILAPAGAPLLAALVARCARGCPRRGVGAV